MFDHVAFAFRHYRMGSATLCRLNRGHNSQRVRMAPTGGLKFLPN